MKPSFFFNTRLSASLMLLALLISGCATSYAPAPDIVGLSPQEVVARLGSPYPSPETLDGVARLEFPRGPYGKHTYIVYFDANGKADRFAQVLNEKNFARIKPDMDVSEVRELIGVSRDTFLLGRERGFVWNYRYITPLCQWFQIEFTKERKVRSTGYGLPPECRKPAVGLR